MNDLDFLPDRIRRERQRRRRLVRQAYLLILCVGGLALLGYLRQGTVSEAQAQLQQIQDRSSSLRQQLALRDELEKQQAELMIMERVEGQLGSRVSALDVLAELERLMPETMSLTSLDLDTMELRPHAGMNRGGRVSGSHAVDASASPARSTRRLRMVLTGVAPSDVDVANFIGQLSASPVFEDVNMGYSRSMVYRDHLAREFQASCYVRR
jgi:Tfp pilus assembly protein PilN